MKKTNKTGFTIVELLIVIVVIGVLAAIVLVTYTGVQNNAKTTKAQTAAKAVRDKIVAYNSKTSLWPNDAEEVVSATPDGETEPVEEALIEDENLKKAVEDYATKKDAKDEIKKNGLILYEPCGPDDDPTGGKVYYFDFGKNELSTEVYTVGKC